jgi:hypothetical protein
LLSFCSSDTSNVNLMPPFFWGLCFTHYIRIIGSICLQRYTCLHLIAVSLGMLSSALSSPSLAWFKLNFHFWKQFTVAMCVIWCLNPAVKYSVSRTCPLWVLHHTATCDQSWKQVFMQVSLVVVFEWPDYVLVKWFATAGAVVGERSQLLTLFR